MVFNPYALLLFLASILMLAGSIRSWNIKEIRATREFSLLALACFLYTFFYALEISATDLYTVLFWIRFEYLGISTIAPALLAFALKYTGRVRKFKTPLLCGLLVIPVITFFLVQTYNHHSLYYINPYLDQSGPFPILAFERGPWYWVQAANITLAILISNVLFLSMWLSANRIYRKKITFLFIGSLFPTLGFFLYMARIWTVNLDITAFMLPLSAVFFYYGLTKLDLFELIPVARNHLFEILPDGVLVFDPRFKLADFNTAAKNYLKLGESAIGQTAAVALAGWPLLAKALIQASNSDRMLEFASEVDGEKRWLRAGFKLLDQALDDHQGQIILLHDISESRSTEEKLMLLASTDYLTGLWNRRYFTDSAEHELKRAARYNRTFSVIMMDLDHFKQINDRHGHSCGDRVLISLAKILKQRLRGIDIAARHGGEEFAILLPDTGSEAAYKLAEDLRKAIAAANITGEELEVAFTVSMGVSTYHQGIKDVDGLLHEVDRALYKAKEKGRNCTVVSTVVEDQHEF